MTAIMGEVGDSGGEAGSMREGNRGWIWSKYIIYVCENITNSLFTTIYIYK